MTHFRLLLALLLVSCSSAVSGKSVDNIRLGSIPEGTRVVLDLSEQLQTYQVLEQSGQLLVEIEGFHLGFDPHGLSLEGTDIAAVQHSRSGEQTLRLVLSLANPVQLNTFTLRPYLTRGHRLVIDMVVVEPEPVSETPRAQVDVPAATSLAATSAAYGDTQGATDTAMSSRLSFDGTWEQEWAIDTGDGDNQKFEAIIEPRVDYAITPGVRLTGIARVRLDLIGELGPGAYRPNNYSSLNGPLYNTEYAELSLRELYLDTRLGESFWRLGKQQVVWGQADGIKVLDVVNPQSFREFILDDFDDSRIPLWMVNAEVPLGLDSSLQFLWIPDTTYHELAEPGSPYAFTSSRIIPQAPAGIPGEQIEADKPDDAFADSDTGLRFSTFVGGWDVSLNYLYHYQDFAIAYQQLKVDDSGLTAVLAPKYERNHLLGGTFSNVFGDITLRAEIAYSTDTFHLSSDLSERGIANSSEIASVLALDWQLGMQDTLLSVQWFQSHLFDYNSNIRRDSTEHNVSLLYRRSFDNETWQFDVLTLYSLNHEDSWVQVKLRYLLWSNLELWLGGDVFSGDKDGVFGQFSNEDRVLLGMELGF